MPPYLLTLLLLASWSWLGQFAAQPTARARWQVNITIDRSSLVAFGDQQLLENFVTQRMTQSMVSRLRNDTTAFGSSGTMLPSRPVLHGLMRQYYTGLALPLCAECLTTATCGASSYCAGDADLSSLVSITTSPAAPPPANLYSCQPAT
ncbi:hypothetical protein HaLaN_08116, partial [Haematococcus lacustris]